MLVLWAVQGPLAMRGDTVSWSELKGAIERGEIARVDVEGDLVHATLRPDPNAEPTATPRVIHAVRFPGDDAFIDLLDAQGVAYQAARTPACDSGGALALFMLVLIGGAVLLAVRRDVGGRGAAAFGRSGARLAPEEGTGVTFADVAGVDEAAEELKETVAFLKTPDRFVALGGRPPKGVLLVGPPGTGKTLLARAVAGEAGVPFFSISGSDFVEMFVGVGAARVRDMFKQAQEHAPCILFIDELDAVGKSRGSGPVSNDEREQTLNQLLVEMDGFDNRKGIIVMAATNRAEILDSALLRPGRFDRQVVVDRPDLRGRLAILKVHAAHLKLGEDVDFEQIAQYTPGFAGADLANLLNEAAILAARRDGTSVTMADVNAAIERVMAGLERKNRRLSPAEKRTVAYHECGHAICAAASPGADPVHKISIIPRGLSALGYTIQLPLEDRYLMSKAELLNRLTVLFGGRAAEELVFGDVTTGAYDDIRRATDLARRMVTEYGMSTRIGAVSYRTENAGPLGPSEGFFGSPHTQEVIEEEIRTVLSRCHERARRILDANRPLLERMSAALLDAEVLDGERMKEFLGQTVTADSMAERPRTLEVLPDGSSI
jgi:cell division protease FtsH